MNIDVFERHESEVRFYCRVFRQVFKSAQGSYLEAEDGRRYLDFFSGAGALNYGHNPDFIRERLIAYLREGGILHGLDMHTVAKREFIGALQERILGPRELSYKIQFCGPTGTNAVEAALKLSRKIKARSGIFAFQGGFHGMSLGSLACSGNLSSRRAAGVSMSDVTFMPYPSGNMGQIDTIAYLEAVLADSNCGIEKPAAVLLETVQAEGGIMVAPVEWLQRLRAVCDRHDILMIVDDVQVGCGRTGRFFSFERAGIQPDIVVLSKSISGCGLPLALVLIKPELDRWSPGEHTGTFRGNQLAFISGAASFELWSKLAIQEQVSHKADLVDAGLTDIVKASGQPLMHRGIGLIWGLDFAGMQDGELIGRVQHGCFEQGLIIERTGRNGQVLKLLPPLTTSKDELCEGLEIIRTSVRSCL